MKTGIFNCKFFPLLLFFAMYSKTVSLPQWFPNSTNAQFGGYVKELPYLLFASGDSGTTGFNNIVHVRINTTWNPFLFLNTELAGRLELFSGKSFDFGENSFNRDALSVDLGYLDLTKTWPAILFGNIDRLWIGFQWSRFNIIFGRQRINWGTNLVWNPNDWYNAYNFLDFDYEERPGTDALCFEYYQSPVSVINLAAEFGKDQENRTFAAMYKFNKFGYDFQMQAGLFELDASFGFSWSGSIAGGGFRGEIAYFQPAIDSSYHDFIVFDTTGNMVAAISGDYTFPNSLYLHSEFLYNAFGTNGPIDDPFQRIQQTLNARMLLPSKFGIFAEVSYTITSLFQGNLALSLNPADGSFYLAPNVTYSLSQNIDFYAIAQLFFGRNNTLYGAVDDILALRFRWSF